LSDDGEHGITLIAFIGSVFSPYYAWRRRRGPADPLRHCALNVALYGQTRRWAMTERGAARIARAADTFAIGPSALHWDGDALVMTINERGMPFGQPLRGTVKVWPQAFTGRSFTLDAAGLHRWSPLAPRAHVEVALTQPRLRWTGTGYLDSNDGDVPLERSFARWHWSRAAMPDATAILYDVSPLAGAGTSLALRIDRAGTVSNFAPPAEVSLRPTRWGIRRATRADGGAAEVRETLEDTPFYARSVLNTHLLGHEVTAMHESLSLSRFSKPWVQAMLPFRMPRV
jgi:carotenoid 1,2-hydratase